MNVNKNEAYLEFKGTVGQDINNSILKNNVRRKLIQEELRARKQEIKEKTDEVQAMKARLDQISSTLKQKETSKTQEEINQGIIDEEEFELLKQKKEAKRQYKLQVEKIKSMRVNLIEIDQTLTALKTSLLQKFEQWFLKKYGIAISDIENPLIN